MAVQTSALRTMPLIAAFVAITLAGCSPAAHDAVVATVGSDPITLGTYEKMYMKNAVSRDSAAATTMEERERFLDLLVKYRLKLLDAEHLGLDRRSDVVGELEEYKGSLAASYLTEREVTAPGIQQLYRRRGEEIRASHILLELSPGASAADSAAAYSRASELIELVLAGRRFDSLAVAHSKDPSASRNSGDLYYFTAGQMVPAFEDAVYAMRAGEISRIPVRTQYGLHIIKVTDRKPAPGERRCGHIMIRFSSTNPTPEDTSQAYARITAIRDSLNANIDFAELAVRNSEDPGSAPRGGDLGWFTRRRWIQPFDEAAMALAAGQISGIVRTVYGYHIIKCTEVRPPKSFDETKQELQTLYQQQRMQADYATYLHRLEAEVGYRRSDSVAALLYGALDSLKSPRDSAWATGVSRSLGAAPLMWVGTAPITADSVLALIRRRSDFSSSPLRGATYASALDKIGENIVFGAKANRLQKENAEFASILQEYKEGILLYQVEQDNIWSRVQTSDSALQQYFADHRDKFTFPDRVRFTDLRSASERASQAAHARLLAGISMEDLARTDSARMQQQTRFQLEFPHTSAKIDKPTARHLAAIGAQMAADSALRLRLIARPDTLADKRQNAKRAQARLKAVISWLAKNHGIPAVHINQATQPRAVAYRATRDSIGADISGRTSIVQGRPESLMLAPISDERARRADSLSAGGYSGSFFHKGTWSIVRLDAREPARQKTFEEAAPEVSTSYQDAESKRLESVWMERLRREYPVEKHPEVLQKAFAPPSP